jgi:hypothetical protein
MTMQWLIDNVPIELVLAFGLAALCAAILLWMKG